MYRRDGRRRRGDTGTARDPGEHGATLYERCTTAALYARVRGYCGAIAAAMPAAAGVSLVTFTAPRGIGKGGGRQWRQTAAGKKQGQPHHTGALQCPPEV